MPSRHSVSPASLASAACGGTFLLGAAVCVGYARHSLRLVRMPSGQGTEMVLNTALGLMAAAVAVLLLPRRRQASTVLGCLLAAASAAVLMENIFGRSFGLDEVSLHLWLGAPDYNPGRMALNTSLAFVCLGAAIALFPRIATWSLSAVVRALAWTSLLVSAAGLAGFLARFDVLYAWNSITRMAPATAVGLLLVSLALWRHGHVVAWMHPAPAVPNAQRILSFATWALAFMALVGGCSGFYLLHGTLVDTTVAHLHQQLDDRVLFISDRLHDRSQIALALAARPQLRADLASPGPALQSWAQASLALGFSSIQIRDPRERVLASAGHALAASALAVRLRQPPAALLLWAGRYVLQVSVPIPGLATATFEQPLPELDRLTGPGSDFGDSGRFELCAPAPDAGAPRASHGAAACFPNRFHAAPVRAAGPNTVAGPIPRALIGASGSMESVDDRQDRIIAAFAPVGDTGLGAALELSMAEFYRPIRIQFWIMLPLLGLLLLVGVAMLHRRIRPLIQEILDAHARAWKLARNDQLTGLLNRSSFLERLEAALRGLRPSAGIVGLLYLDLDWLKVINDTRGHLAGDAMLREFAQRLRGAVRATDAVARLGGDEFTVLLEHMDTEQDAERIAHAILASLSAPLELSGGAVQISTSIGIACLHGGPALPDDFLHRADQALYRAKQTGRGRYVVYTPAAAGA